MKNYYRLMLGRKSAHAEICFSGGFIGTDYSIHQDLTGRLPNAWRAFNKELQHYEACMEENVTGRRATSIRARAVHLQPRLLLCTRRA